MPIMSTDLKNKNSSLHNFTPYLCKIKKCTYIVHFKSKRIEIDS